MQHLAALADSGSFWDRALCIFDIASWPQPVLVGHHLQRTLEARKLTQFKYRAPCTRQIGSHFDNPPACLIRLQIEQFQPGESSRGLFVRVRTDGSLLSPLITTIKLCSKEIFLISVMNEKNGESGAGARRNSA